MEDFKKKLIHLHHCRGIGWKSIHKILTLDPALSGLYDTSFNNWKKLLQIPDKQVHDFLHDLQTQSIDDFLQQYLLNDIQCITIYDPIYPAKLRNIYDPPWVLYIRGDMELLSAAPILAVVGPRKPSSYGIAITKSILAPLVKKGYVIISGLASGIDAISHQTALQFSGKTIGVLGGGIFHLYPKENIPLAIEMMKKGTVLSEYPPFKKPEPWMFPNRNRIISGMAEGVLITEAKEKSGSLITAYCALEQGREVFAVPGNITSSLSAGTNKLIQEGAKTVLTHVDIEEEFSLAVRGI
ncbi:DNA-processing protein DprA [Peribacillus deserti]|uniref:DNA-protecting protein DprA n=1 Tax=Peribacillus deserti TaxID=673318 RepID=A0A2N5M6W7_9BACI|nr:DNA-processing protein DprA [Peribacillus deserti]PLT30072.1 DNA-protecting protein DprA [Peribacillus deserti]